MFEDNTFEASASAFPTGQGKLEKVEESRGKCKITWKVSEKWGIAHRWVENVPVSEQRIDIFQNSNST